MYDFSESENTNKKSTTDEDDLFRLFGDKTEQILLKNLNKIKIIKLISQFILKKLFIC